MRFSSLPSQAACPAPVPRPWPRAAMYLQSHPEVKIHIFDTLSTGPEMQLLAEKLAELHAKGGPPSMWSAKGTGISCHHALSFKSPHNLKRPRQQKSLRAPSVFSWHLPSSPPQVLRARSSSAKCRGEKVSCGDAILEALLPRR